MDSLEIAVLWLGQAWKLLFVFSIALVLVSALRRPCRRLLGAERAFQLWLLVPLLLLVAALPHPRSANPARWKPVVLQLIAAPVAPPAHAAAADELSWQVVCAAAWNAGFLAMLVLAALAQRRYYARLGGAMRLFATESPYPVWRARQVDVGPALVGAWRPWIVVPSDFEARYEPAEQKLILSHEAMHARRGDGWYCLLAQLFLAGFWFQPMAWWAWRAFRHDQELACDAAVLRRHAGERHRYAMAMLKTQATRGLLPVGCPWSPRHPLTERISMLKRNPPSTAARHAGRMTLAAIALGAVGIVYAAGPATTPVPAPGKADHYGLTIDVATHGHPASMHFSRCVGKGESFSLSGTDGAGFSWDGRFAVFPATQEQLEVRAMIHTRTAQDGGADKDSSVRPIVRTHPGQRATIAFGEMDASKGDGSPPANSTLRLDLTPELGCSGALTADTWTPGNVSAHAKGQSARKAALALAAKGGFTLVNPEALDENLVSFNFEQMSAVSALQLIADIDGKRAVFRDKQVRFEPK